MSFNKNLCYSCMHEVEPDCQICPNCLNSTKPVNELSFLKVGTLLMDRYLVGEAISQNNTSITYIGYDNGTDNIIHICEFFPKNIVSRDFTSDNVAVSSRIEETFVKLEREFIYLNTKLFELKQTFSLPNVYHIFNDNSTTYSVSSVVDTITLEQYIQELEKDLTWKQIYNSFSRTILPAVKVLHENGIYHTNINPKTILVGVDGKLRLTGFEINAVNDLSSVIYRKADEFFSAPELLSNQNKTGAKLDVYSIVACMIYMFTHNVLERDEDEKVYIPKELKSRLPLQIVSLIDSSLAIDPNSRIDSVEKVFASMRRVYANNSNQGAKKITSTKGKSSSKSKNNSNKKESYFDRLKTDEETKQQFERYLKITAIALGVLVVVLLVIGVLSNKGDKPDVDATVPETTTEVTVSDTTQDLTQAPTETEQDTEEETESTVEVPDFSKFNYASIVSNSVYNQKFNFLFEMQYNDAVKRNDVVSQSVKQGETVNVGTTITIVISKGKETVVLKDVVGMNFDEAKKLLIESGFIVKKEDVDTELGGTQDEVFEMSLVANLEYPKGTEIMLSVWKELTTAPTTEETTEETTEATTQEKSETTTQVTTQQQTTAEIETQSEAE